MKRKRPRPPKPLKSPFPATPGAAPADPALLRPLEALEKLAPAFLFAPPTREVPEWVEKAGEIVLRAALPPVFSDPGAPVAARIGAVLGRVDSLDAWLSGELELTIPPEVQAEWENALRVWDEAKLPPKLAQALERKVGKLEDWLSARPKRRRVLAQVAATAALAPYTESREFQHAHDQGSTLPVDWIEGRWLSREAALCLRLLLLWPLCEQAPSVTALHGSLARTFKPSEIGDLKGFHRLCKKIGLRLRGRGRPRKQK